MQILGHGKVRIMRFSGRKGDLESVFVGIRSRRKGQRRAANGPDRFAQRCAKSAQREKEERGREKSGRYYRPVKEERGKREQGGGGGKLPQICDRNEK